MVVRHHHHIIAVLLLAPTFLPQSRGALKVCSTPSAAHAAFPPGLPHEEKSRVKVEHQGRQSSYHSQVTMAKGKTSTAASSATPKIETASPVESPHPALDQPKLDEVTISSLLVSAFCRMH